MSYEIIVGDCVDVMRGMDDDSVDLTVTSPPYDNLRTYEGTCEWSRDVWENALSELYRITKTGGVVVWVVGDATVNGSETGTSFRQAIHAQDIGFRIHDTMIWNKGGFTATGSLSVRYASVFEYMLVFSKGKPRVFNPIKDRKAINPGVISTGPVRQNDGTFKRMNERKPRPKYGQRFNIWRVAGACKKDDRSGHPAPMPISIAQDHIVSWSNEGDTVFDPFTGGGTTGVAALRTGRKFIGVEKVEEYAQLARDRIEAATPQGVAV